MLSRPRPRDYLETGDEWYFAVVSSMVEDGAAIVSLRYVRRDGRLVKLGTGAANEHLALHRPGWLVHSTVLDALVHRLPLAAVVRVHRPDARLAALVQEGAAALLEDRVLTAVRALGRHGAPVIRLGLGGSLLLGTQHPDSDIDLIAYGRAAFDASRAALGAAIAAGDLGALRDEDWRAAWERRGSELGLEEYVLQERRKHNKATVRGTRVDLSLVVDAAEEIPERGPFQKLGRAVVQAVVTDATAAFDQPARYRVRSDRVSEVLSFTPTYAGQAVAGETIEAAGLLERDADGVVRLVVGSSREAVGEWIRVVVSRQSSVDSEPARNI